MICGKGMISLMQNDAFQLRMYADIVEHTENLLKEFSAMANRVSGQILLDSEYYKLEATDISGCTWVCEKVLIEKTISNHGMVIKAKIDLLVHRTQGLTPPFPSVLSMYFFQDINVPYTQYVETTSRSCGRMIEQGSTREVATFSVDAFHFEVKKVASDKGSTILSAHSMTDPFPVGVENRIQEALRYVTFRPISCCIVEKQQQGVREVIITHSAVSITKCLFDEPVHNHRPDCADDYWRLFSAYFRHVVTYADELHYHPLSAELFRVISTGTRQLDVVGLLVSVAVEGVLNCEFNDIAKPSPELVADIEHTIKLARRLECNNVSLSKRLCAALNAMKHSRAKDKLRNFKDRGLITKDMFDAWDKLRNSSAHANSSIHADASDLQLRLNRCYTTYALLNILVFHAIKYSGKYQDYSEIGWPTKDFGVLNQMPEQTC